MPVPADDHASHMFQVFEGDFDLDERPHVTCGVPKYGATFEIDAKEIMHVPGQDKIMDRPNYLSIMNDKGSEHLAGIDCTDRAAQEYLDDDDVSKVKLEVESDLESDCTSVLNTLFEESDEDKSVAGEKSGETVKIVQSGMDNSKLIENIVSDVKGERLMEMTQRLLEDEISEHIVERLIDVLVRQIREQFVEIAKVIVQKCLKHHTKGWVLESFAAPCWGGGVPVA